MVEDTWTVEEDLRREEVDVDEGTAGRTLQRPRGPELHRSVGSMEALALLLLQIESDWPPADDGVWRI
jgi:hypothetical protein